MNYYFALLLSLTFFSCTIGASNSKPIETKNNSSEANSYQTLVDLEQLLVNPDLSLNSTIADSLYNEALTYLLEFPKSKQRERVLVLAAKCSDGLNLIPENIRLIDQLLAEFPLSENAPNYLYNKGKIYEEKLNDIATARLIYNELIIKFPNSELAQSISLYLDFLNKSEQEQLNFLKNQ